MRPPPHTDNLTSPAALEGAGHITTVKPMPLRRNRRLGADQFTRDDFHVDRDRGQVTCPAGETVGISSTGRAWFGRVCTDCAFRSRCTTNKRGRQILINPHDRLLALARRQWKHPPTRHRYNKYRPTVERLIAHLVTNGHRKLRYRGTTRNRQQLHTRVAAINLRRLINLGLHPTTTGWATNPT